jgi:hypothetical protein
MAAGLAVAGLIAAAAVSKKEEQEEKAEQMAEQTDTQEVVSEATAQALGQAPFALLGTLAAAPGGATTLLPVVRLLARNLPSSGRRQNRRSIPPTPMTWSRDTPRTPTQRLMFAVRPRCGRWRSTPDHAPQRVIRPGL